MSGNNERRKRSHGKRRRKGSRGDAATANPDNYEKREISDEDAKKAQQFLDEVVEDVEQVDDKGILSPEEIEQEYGIDIYDIDVVPADKPIGVDEEDAVDYPRLNHHHYKVQKALQEQKYPDDEEMKDAVKTVGEYLKWWKGSSNSDDAATLEAIAIKAHGIDREPRKTGEVEWDNVNEQTAQAYRDYTNISRTFLREHMADEDGKMRLQRGMNSRTNSFRLFESMIENPNADAYEINGSALANYTTSPHVTEEFTKTFQIEQELDVEDIAMAEDMVGNPSTSLREAEIHVIGDRQIIDADNITVPEEGYTEVFEDTNQLHETLSVVDNPETASYEEQTSFANAINQWKIRAGLKERYKPQSEVVKNRLENVVEAAKQSDNWSRAKTNEIEENIAILFEDSDEE